jgi:hypothetical protein
MSWKTLFPQPPGMTLKGRWSITLQGPDGQIKDYREGDNVVCTNGKEFLASFLASAAAAASTFTMKYVAIGTDATGEAAGNTALGAEVARHTGTVSYVSNQVYRVTATFATGVGTGTIVEYGLLSANASGTLLSRDTESAISKGANDTLTAVVNLTIS